MTNQGKHKATRSTKAKIKIFVAHLHVSITRCVFRIFDLGSLNAHFTADYGIEDIFCAFCFFSRSGIYVEKR